MAFKVLSSNEIELLTENQRENYEKELAIYNERVKFVEQMEKFENTVITPYEPKLENISAISKAPEKTYSNPEYVVKTVDLISKPVPKVVMVNFDEPVTAFVPKSSKVENVSVEHIRRVEQDKPTMPQISKAAVPVRRFIRSEQQPPVLPARVKTIVPNKDTKKTKQIKPILPTAVKPQSFAKLAFVAVSIDNEAIKACNPNITSPTINLPALTLPEKTQPILPQSSVKFPEVKVFEVPEQNPVLPKAVIPGQISVSFSKTNIQQVELLIAQKAVIPAKKFVKSEHSLADLPTVSTPKAGVQSYIAPEIKKTELPVYKTVIPTKKFVKSEHSLADLPAVVTPKPSVESYTAPEIKKSDLPTFVKPVVTSRPYYKPIVGNTPKIEYSSINVIPVKTFEKVSSQVRDLPSVSAVAIPDAYSNESLKNLLLSYKENETKKGVRS